MTKERFLNRLLSLAASRFADYSAPTSPAARDSGAGTIQEPSTSKPFKPELYKWKAEWRALLSPEAFGVLFEAATEPPGTSTLTDECREGTYLCAACFTPLFSSETKYDSRSGWPSFWTPITDAPMGFRQDVTLGPRTECYCLYCGGHHGHVFDDGPPPTGKRYCNNGLSLRFVPLGEPIPKLRT